MTASDNSSLIEARYRSVREALVTGRDSLCSDEHRQPFDEALVALEDLRVAAEVAEHIASAARDYIASEGELDDLMRLQETVA
jgi:hypothetical protein